MASRNAAVALAQALLTPENIDITQRIILDDFGKAMQAKDVKRVRELSQLLELADRVKDNGDE